MFSMVALGRIFFEEEGVQHCDSLVEPVLKGYRKAETDIHDVAAGVLSPDQMRGLMMIIRNWRTNNPVVKSLPLIRFSNFAADRRDSSLTKIETLDGLFDSVESASQTAEEMRLLAERSVYMATRMPQTRTEFARLLQGTDQMAAVTEELPDKIALEREATIEQFMAHLLQEHDKAVEQLVSGISPARQAFLVELLSAERKIEDRCRHSSRRRSNIRVKSC
jgi:hypothetical protein